MNLPNGLTLIGEFIDETEESTLLNIINISPWNTSLKRRTQHYGYEYKYTSRDIGDPIEPIPVWANLYQERMLSQKIITVPFEQLIINEYKPGQGISKHTDAKLFGDTIVSLSLGSSCNMIFRNRFDSSQVMEITLPRRTLLIMKGEARWNWTHEIPTRRIDTYFQ